MTDQEPAIPTGADTLFGVLRRAQERGYRGQFVARDDGDVTCNVCDNVVNPAAIDVEHTHRLEGASDAADLLLVALCVCPACRAKGVLTMGFGPNASTGDQTVLTHLSIRPETAWPVD